jgi:Flp pilus assembly protein TadG
MRVSEWVAALVRARTGDDERGVTAVVVALVMTGLLSVTAVTLDYGSASVVRRETQNAADAAARAVAEKCARGGGVTAACLTLTPDENGIVEGNAASSVVESVTQPAAGRVKVTVRKKVEYQLASLLGRSSDMVRSSATASLSAVHPTEGYPVLPLAASYCTFKNNSTYAGTPTEASHKVALRTDTLQSVANLVSPLTSTARSLLETGGVLKELGTGPVDQCADVDGTQIGTLKGAVWLTGETVVSDVTSGLFGWDASKCELRVGSDLKTFLGGLTGAALLPPGCPNKFGNGKPVDIGKTILIPIYKPKSTLRDTYGLKLATVCASVLSGGRTCLEVPPKIGVDIVGYAPFKVSGWKYPGNPANVDGTVACSDTTLRLDLSDVILNTLTVAELLVNLTLNVVNTLLGTSQTASISCNGLQGYFTKTYTKDPNFQYGTGGADLGAGAVRIVD